MVPNRQICDRRSQRNRLEQDGRVRSPVILTISTSSRVRLAKAQKTGMLVCAYHMENPPPDRVAQETADTLPVPFVKVSVFLSSGADFDRDALEGAVLFSDLVGSTEFKSRNTIQDGLAKTLLHNKVCSAGVSRFGGRVVKYIGDSVMGLFLGPDSARVALDAASAILSGIDEANTSQGWVYPKAMSTRIGAHFGKLWMFKYDESNAHDPQGTTVDVAARLSKIGDVQTIVCSDFIFNRAGGQNAYPLASDLFHFPIRGLKDHLPIRVLSHSRDSKQQFSLQRRFGDISAAVRKAGEIFRSKGRAECVKCLTERIREDPLDFHALIMKAEMHMFALEEDVNKINDRLAHEIFQILSLCKCLRPHSSKVWLIMSRFQYRHFRHTNDQRYLDEAVDSATNSLGCSEDGLNPMSAVLAKTYLAKYLRQYCVKFADPSNEKLLKALEYCEDVQGTIGAVTSSVRYKYLITHASVLLAKGGPCPPEVDEMIAEAKHLQDKKEIEMLDAELYELMRDRDMQRAQASS